MNITDILARIVTTLLPVIKLGMYVYVASMAVGVLASIVILFRTGSGPRR